MDLSRCVGWYLLAFLATYIVRPGASEIIGDIQMYRWLRIGTFEDHWQLMAIAVPLAIIAFAIAYAGAGPRRVEAFQSPSRDVRVIDPHSIKVLIFVLVTLGYISSAVVLKTGNPVEAGDYANAAVGVYEHNTAWFAHDDLFVSTGALLYYIVTGRLGMSIIIAGPWMLMKLISGWGRTNLLGHLFSLMAIYFLKVRFEHRKQKKSTHALFLSGAVVVVLVLFPFLAEIRSLKQSFHMDTSALSKDAIAMVGQGADPQDLMQSYLGTNSSVAGFETTLSHLINDKKSELGTQYLYYYFIQPIPRIIWPGKGTPYTWPERLRGIEVDPLLALIGAAPGSIGMAFQEWGWLGIPFEFMLTGWILRKAEEAARSRSDALHVQLGYAGLYSMLPQLGRDSIIYMISTFWLFKYGIAMFILWRMYKAAPTRAVWERAAARQGPVKVAIAGAADATS